MKLKTKELTTCALFAALIAIGAFIKVDIPLPMYTMHFTFQWFFVDGWFSSWCKTCNGKCNCVS